MLVAHGSDIRYRRPHHRPPRPLPAAARARLEQVLGHDLSDVRILESDAPARIGARAFAFGRLVVVPRAADLFADAAGWWLLGHELAHVIQQREGRVPATGAAVNIVQDAALEREANAMGDAAARAFRTGPSTAPAAVTRRVRPPVRFRPVIQCVMQLDEFRNATATKGIRSFDRIAAIDTALKAFHEVNSRRPKSYTDLSRAAKKLYEAAKGFKGQKPDSSRMPGVDRLIREIVIEDAVLSRLAEFEAETDEVEKFRILETVQENFFKQRDRTELNNRTLEGEIFTLLQGFLASASNRGEAFVLRDIEELIALGRADGTPGLLKSVIAECTAARNIQKMDAANGKPGLKYSTARGSTQKYSLNHAMEQSLGKRFRLGSLLHELTHLSIAEIFDNTCVMLAISPTASDAEVLSLAKTRNALIQQLIAQIDRDLPEFERLTSMTIEQQGVKRNRLYVEFKEKALYPVSGKFASQYLVAFGRKMDAEVLERLKSLAGQGLDCELIEYDTVVNQMLLWAHLYGMSPTCGTYTSLEAMVRDAHAYRLRGRVLRSGPPQKPLPQPPTGGARPLGKPLPPVPVRGAGL